MKIQIVSWRDPLNPKAGGAEVCLVEIARRLEARFGHEIAWFAPEFPGGSPAAEHEGIAIERRGRFATVHANVLRRFRGRRRQTADVYIEDYHGVTLGLAWLLTKPHVIFVHEVADRIWLEMWPFPVSWTGFLLEKATLRLLGRAHFVAVSESTRRDLVAHGIRAEQITTISEGSDLPPVDRPIPRRERPQRFVFLGRVCKMKRVDLLLEAFARHREVHPKSTLVLAGTVDEGFRRELEAIAARERLEGSFELRGRVSVEEKRDLLQTSLALVSCSMHEGFGLVVVEASSQGTPSLTFDVRGYRDLVVPGTNGFLVPFPDVKALGRRMSDLVTLDEHRFDELAARSLEESRRYSWDKTAADVDRLLRRLTG
ncbi:MAG: glycosyltransferase family 4 protein [Deltaproteobacteria bacterium]|nr:glycosyltransferase family 4 protein [Deltaproteobacteria bacterium]